MVTFRQGLLAAAIALGLQAAMAAQPSAAPGRHGSSVPAEIDVPPGHVLFFRAWASGTQNYICLATPAGLAWQFVGPQATLYQAGRGKPGQQLTTHFLSANPDEAGTLRPTWQHSFDTSRIWARAAASSADPAYVEQGAIPWLLLDVVGAERGPGGGGFLTQAAYIQRLHTSGGVAPASGCTQPSQIGTLNLVPYTAEYAFYRPRRGW